jgi:hypothetical protein
MPRLYYIRIPDRQEYTRAIGVFLDCRDTRCVYPDNVMAVTDEHLKALEQAQVVFEYLHQGDQTSRFGSKSESW